MDLNRLTKGERILGISAALLLILSFLPLWAKLEIETGIAELDSTSRFSAWSDVFGFLLKLGLVLAIVALVLVALRAAGTALTLPVPNWQIYAVCAGVTLLLLLITVLTGPKGDQGSAAGYEYSRGLAIFIAPVLGAAMAYGAFLTMSEEGGSLPTRTTTSGTGPTDPPPPAS